MGWFVLTAKAQDLRIFTAQSLADITARRAGQPFVLAFWSLECTPCLSELADLGRRNTRALVLVSTDGPRAREAVLAVLARHGLDEAQAWVFADIPPERLRHTVDPAWLGELPRSYFYEADGKRLVVSGRPNAAMLDRWLGPRRTGIGRRDIEQWHRR
jgi:hypothetical protein